MKKVEHICGNCLLYNPEKGHCGVVILNSWVEEFGENGEKVHLPVFPNDKCFFENKFQAIHKDKNDETINKIEYFTPAEDLKEVRFWVENEKGEKVKGNGTVKIEYPAKDFFNEA